MNRVMFVRMATLVLQQMGDAAAAAKAEAIASQMDMIAAVMGETPAAAPAPAAPPRPAFPSPNPEAIGPIVAPPEPFVPQSGPPLIIPATTIPDRAERAALRKPTPPPPPPDAERMKVEDLNMLLQQRAPQFLKFDLKREDGSTGVATLQRDTISMHAFDTVKLVYYPPGATLSQRELTEVSIDLNVDDVPFDMNAIVARLTEQAAQSLAPRRIHPSLTPPQTPGPVKSHRDTYQDPNVNQAIAAFQDQPADS